MEAVSSREIAFDARGLVPAVVQDARTGEVLMVAYMNEASLARTVATGETWFWSRSRQTLWHKGEESGHFQHVRRIYVDCDADTLVVEVVPEGPACHTGSRSCFFRTLAEWENRKGPGSLRILWDLYEEIRDRRAYPQNKSYTNYLQQEGKNKIDKKIGEEAAEVIIADQHEDRAEIVSESCDLLYHLFVLWENAGVSLTDVLAEMEARDEKKGNKKDEGHQDKIF